MESFQFHGTAFNGRVTGRLVQFHTLQLNPYKWKVLHYGNINLTLQNETLVTLSLTLLPKTHWRYGPKKIQNISIRPTANIPVFR